MQLEKKSVFRKTALATRKNRKIATSQPQKTPVAPTSRSQRNAKTPPAQPDVKKKRADEPLSQVRRRVALSSLDDVLNRRR
jgi:hypothetical protein